MNIADYKKHIIRLAAVLAFLLPVYLLYRHLSGSVLKPAGSDAAAYVGSESCKSCHLTAYNDWRKSHHYHAMALATDSTMRGKFDTQLTDSHGTVHKLYKKDGKFMAYTDGADGNMHEFEIKYVFGYTPLQQYLVEFDRGRLQTLPLTWNTEDENWYYMPDSVYKGQNIDHTNWLHWTNQAQNWNSMCAECHSTNLQKGYDYQNDSYQTTYSEISVGCESCHGAGSKHLDWANLPDYTQKQQPNMGLEVKTSGLNAEDFVNRCVRCHSRKSYLDDFKPEAQSIFDHMLPMLPGEPNWFIDGQIKEEDYVYASFLQSKMYHRDIKCSDCHNVHSGERLLEGNKLCLQCHNKDVYDTPQHHHHKTEGMTGKAVISESGLKFDVGSGAQCVNCHMPGRYYMGVDYRNDHSFRVPRPDLSIKYDVPNACTQCHADQNNQWALRYVNEWYGGNHPKHFVEVFAEAQNNNPSALHGLKELLGNDQYPAIIRSRAIADVGNLYPDSAFNILLPYFTNPDPLLRLQSVQSVPPTSQPTLNAMLLALKDPTKAVRVEAARQISQQPQVSIPANYTEPYQKALKEYEATLQYNADFPVGKANLAGYYYSIGNLDKAEEFYEKALEQDTELYFVYLNLASIYNRSNRKQEAANSFRAYLNAVPNDASTLFSLALLETELTHYDESLNLMLKAHTIDPNIPRLNRNIAMMYDFKNDNANAQKFMRMELNTNPDEQIYTELLQMYVKQGELKQALALCDEIISRYPNNKNAASIRLQLKDRKL